MTNISVEPEEYLRLLFAEGDDAVLVASAPGANFVSANPAATRLLGLTEEEFRELTYTDLLAEGEVESTAISLKDPDIPGSGTERRMILHKDGSTIPVEARAKQTSTGIVLVVIRDLRPELETQRAIEERDSRLSVLFEESNDAILVVPLAVDGLILASNPAAITTLGFSEREFRSKTYASLLAPGEADRVPLRDMRSKPKSEFSTERTLVRKDGTEIIAAIRSKLLSNDTVMISFRDVTAERAAEAATRERDEQLRVLFDEAPDAVFVAPRGGKESILTVNSAATEILGYSEQEFLGMGYNDLLAPGEIERRAIFNLDSQPGGQAVVERELIRTDGSKIMANVRSKLLSNNTIMYTVRDVTLEKTAEAAIRERDARLRLLFEEGADPVLFIATADTRIVEHNQAALDFFGYSAGELAQLKYLDMVTEQNLLDVPLLVGRQLEGAIRIRRELTKKDGSVANVDVLAQPILGDFTMVVLRDVTDRVRAESELRETQERLTRAQESAGIVGWEWDCLADAMSTFGDAETIFKIRPIQGASLEDFMRIVLREDQDRVRAKFREYAESGDSFVLEHRIFQPGGTTRMVREWITVERDRDGTALRFVAAMQDVTNLRDTEARLTQAQQLAQLDTWEYDVVADAIHSIRPETIMGEATPPAATRDQWLGSVHREDQERVAKEVYDSIESGDTLTSEHRIVRRGGVIRNVQLWGRVDRDASGRALRIRGATQDVTDLRSAERALRRSEEQLRSLITEAPVSLLELDHSGVITAAAGQGIVREDLVGMQFSAAFEGQPAFVDLLEAAYEGAAKDGLVQLDIDSTTHASLRPTKDESGQVSRLLVVLVDVTAQTQLQDQLNQSRRLEAIGQLAGGIAHDFNNLLTVINGNSELSLSALNGSEPVSSYVSDVLAAGVRAADLTQQLLAFSRNQPISTKLISVNESVESTFRLLSRLLGPEIELVTELGEAMPVVEADAGQLEQALINLCVNARDAMPDGGCLTISTATVRAADGQPQAQITVTDTGVGMDKATLSHIFEPFFTTKELGKGTGLGLATVYGIVQQAGGTVTVKSAPGKGTTFVIKLPGGEFGD